MATKTFGTATTSSLTAIQIPDLNGTTTLLLAADVATIKVGILDDFIGVDGGPWITPGNQNFAARVWPGAIDFTGAGRVLLHIPNRGTLQALPGDWIAIDPNTGWPILVSGNSVPSTLTATGTTSNTQKTVTFSSSVLTLGWNVGLPCSETNVPASSFIQQISSDGKTVTLNNAATGSAANTMTVSNWTHS